MNRKLLSLTAMLVLSASLAGAAPDRREPLPEVTPKERYEMRNAVRALTARRPGRTSEAIATLEDFGVKAHVVIDDLARLLVSGRNANGQEGAAQVLSKLAQLDIPEALSALLKALDKIKDDEVLASTLHHIAEVGEPAQVGAKLIAEHLDSKSEAVQQGAIRAISRTGVGKAKDVDKKLEAALEGSPATALEAAMALARLGLKSDKLLPLLLARLEDTKAIDEDRERAAETIGYLGADGAKAVPALKAIVEHRIDEAYNPALPYGSARKQQNDKLRRAAIISLGKIGPAASEAIPALETAASEDAMSEVAKAALAAIRG